MSWDASWSGNRTVHERAEARWTEHESEMARAQQGRQHVARRDKGPTGLVREPLDIDVASTALDDLNEALNEALDVIRQARERDQVRQRAKATRVDHDAERAPAMKGRA